MTLSDLWLIVRHYFKVVIISPVVCAVLMGCIAFVPTIAHGSSCKATATLAISDPSSILDAASLSSLMNAIAQSEASAVDNDTIAAAVESDSATQSVSFTIAATNENDAILIANMLVSQTAESIRQILDNQSDTYLEVSDEAAQTEEGIAQLQGVTAADRAAALRCCVLTVSEAKVMESSSRASVVLKYALAGLVGGLILVICALALYDSIKRPIKGRGDIAEVTDLPILAEGTSALLGERLWVNIQFVKEDVKTICILPITGVTGDQIAITLTEAIEDYCSRHLSDACLRDAQEANFPTVIECNALNSDITGVRVARKSDITLLVVQLWSDSTSTLRNALAELKLAGASVEGLIVLYK